MYNDHRKIERNALSCIDVYGANIGALLKATMTRNMGVKRREESGT